jgi:DnaJ-class molecular chaperone
MAKVICPTCKGTGLDSEWTDKPCPKCHGKKKIYKRA